MCHSSKSFMHKSAFFRAALREAVPAWLPVHLAGKRGGGLQSAVISRRASSSLQYAAQHVCRRFWCIGALARPSHQLTSSFVKWQASSTVLGRRKKSPQFEHGLINCASDMGDLPQPLRPHRSSALQGKVPLL